MADLNFYLQGVQRLLREQKQEWLNTESLIEYINDARREVAQRTQCVRRLTPISGSVITSAVVTAGSGYSNSPTVTITPPDFPPGNGPKPNGDQATAQAIVSGGSIAAIDITYGGYGYFAPQVKIADTTGTGATATVATSPINATVLGQEVYNFSDIDVTPFPGVEAVYAIRSVSIIYSNFRYSLVQYSFSVYQARVRNYPLTYQYVPMFCTQFGQGADGSLYMYPIASSIYQIEYDCACTPQDLIDNESVDVIPAPWHDVVKYWAASLAYGELQNWNASEYYLKRFDAMTLRKSDYARIGRAVNPYGRPY